MRARAGAEVSSVGFELRVLPEPRARGRDRRKGTKSFVGDASDGSNALNEGIEDVARYSRLAGRK